MTVQDVLAKYSEASSAAKVGDGLFVRNGNWEPISRALRHFKERTATIEEAGALNGDAVLLITPSDQPDVKPLTKYPPFYLVVK